MRYLAQALSEVHAAGVCLLDIRADSIWVTQAGIVTFLDFSMAHEYVPGQSTACQWSHMHTGNSFRSSSEPCSWF